MQAPTALTAKDSTIVAVATGPSRGGIGVVRISGPQALAVGRALAPALAEAPTPRRAVYGPLLDAGGATVDQGLALYFQAPHSYTGEDVVELHAHGSPRLLSLLVDAAVAQGRARPAEAGEFTRRAFLNGRIDLTRAEAVAELCASESEAQVRAAAAQLAGGLAAAVREAKAPLLALAADLEGALEFPDEAQVDEPALAGRLEACAGAVAALQDRCRRGALIRRGARVVLFGPVNAGKSTLFNHLVGEARALVDADPGTTRDALFAPVEWSGLPFTLVDTAGLREAQGRVEALGLQKTREALAAADFAVLLAPADLSEKEVEALRGLVPVQARLLLVGAKGDLEKHNKYATLCVSGATGAGVEALRAQVVAALGAGAEDALALGGARHRDALERSRQALACAKVALAQSTLEVVAGEVGLALAALDEVTGEDAPAEVLDAIFERFCIGK